MHYLLRKKDKCLLNFALELEFYGPRYQQFINPFYGRTFYIFKAEFVRVV